MALLPDGIRVCSDCGTHLEDYTVIWAEGAWWDYCLPCVAGALLRRLASAKNVSTDGMSRETKQRIRQASLSADRGLE